MGQIVATTLGLQQLDGHFDPAGPAAPCADFAAVDILVKLSLLINDQAERIRAALGYAFAALAADWAATVADPAPARLRLLALALNSARYPGEFAPGAAWQFAPRGLPGWHDPRGGGAAA
jgi:hypothetical protein